MHRAVISALLTLGLSASGCRAAEEPTLTSTSCADVSAAIATGPIECATLQVFENRRTERGRRIPIRIVVLRAGDGPARAALFLLAGGPGTGGSSLIDVANGWLQPARATLDVILVDQRGTGASQPLHCDSVGDRDPALVFGHIFPPDAMRRCRETLSASADLSQYTTAVAVEDIDDVRAALGYERISLYGQSYGTRVAQAYARRFPSRVRSIVLDGVVPFDAALPVTYAAGAQRALDLVVANCRDRLSCRAAHPGLAKEFKTLLARFAAGPVPVTIASNGAATTVGMSLGDFGYAVRGVLYGARAVAELPEMIGRAAASGDLSEFAQRYWDRAARLDRSLARGLHLSVLCAEDVAFLDPTRVSAAVDGTFLGRYVMDEYRRACEQWGVPRVDDAARSPLESSAPTLLVSGQFDPVTPPEFGESVARHLSNARHIVSPAGAHGSAAGCPRAAVLHVLISGTLEGLPAVCRP